MFLRVPQELEETLSRHVSYEIYSDGRGGYSLNVYGLRDKYFVKEVGYLLARGKIYLQLPTRLDLRKKYINPHHFDLERRDLTPCKRTDQSETAHGQDCIHETDNPSAYFSLPANRSSSHLLLKACDPPLNYKEKELDTTA